MTVSLPKNLNCSLVSVKYQAISAHGLASRSLTLWLLESVTKVRWLVSSRNPRKTTVRLAGRPSGLTVATWMYLECRRLLLRWRAVLRSVFHGAGDIVVTFFMIAQIWSSRGRR